MSPTDNAPPSEPTRTYAEITANAEREIKFHMALAKHEEDDFLRRQQQDWAFGIYLGWMSLTMDQQADGDGVRMEALTRQEADGAISMSPIVTAPPSERTWTYAKITASAEVQITKYMARARGATGALERQAYRNWAFGSFRCWFDITKGEQDGADYMRLIALTEEGLRIEVPA